jgi:hypothetical protein
MPRNFFFLDQIQAIGKKLGLLSNYKFAGKPSARYVQI